jgi:hypothetical protein
MNPENIERETLDFLLSLVDRMRDADSGLSVKDRKWYLKSYPACFVGSEAVDWLLQHEPSVNGSRDAAVQLGLEIQAAGLVQHVTRDHLFKALFSWMIDCAPSADRSLSLSLSLSLSVFFLGFSGRQSLLSLRGRRYYAY